MAETPSILGPTRRASRGGTEPRTFSLMEVAQETGIAMPILLRYKRENPDRIPSVGSGSQQRFPEEAFAIFAELHRQETEQRDLPRRGGFGLLSLPRARRAKQKPAEDGGEAPGGAQPALTAEPPASRHPEPEAAPAPAPAQPAEAQAAAPARAADPGAATLTLKAISDELGIAYPTIARYATKHIELIPHVGEGRQRRFPPEALEVFLKIRKESKPGRPPKSRSKKKAVAAPAAPPAARPAYRAPTAPMPGRTAAPVRSEGDLLRRIERLESHQQQLETMVRRLREEVARPLTAIVEPA